ncbi:MAG: EamA family transporter [Ignavibacteriae bacterium]|nr:EamA family transporter [Ignavibacteriota bacterium]
MEFLLDKTQFRAYLAWVSICIVWGTTYLAVKIGIKDLPPMLFTGIRWFIAGPTLLLFLIFRKMELPPKSEIKNLIVIGIMLIGLSNGFLVYAQKWVPSGLSSLLITTLPFWIVSIESFLPDKPNLNKYIFGGLIIGFFGVSLIFFSEIGTIFNPGYLTGILFILASIWVWSSGSIYAKYKKFNSHPLMRASIQMITAGILQIIIGLILGEQNEFTLSEKGIYAMIYLIIFGSFLGYVAYIYAISILPVSFVSTYSYINPVIALFLGWYYLNEKIDLTTIMGSIVILLGVALVQYGSRKNLKKA